MDLPIWISVVVVGLAAGLSPALWRPLLRLLSVIDVPNERSSHTRTTLRGGGLGPLFGLLVGAVPILVGSSGLAAGSVLPIISIVATGMIMSGVGLLEDVRGLSVLSRAGLQVVVGAGLGLVLHISGGLALLWTPVVAIGFAAFVNFANFMDGINGISSLYGLAAGLSYAVIGVMVQRDWLVLIGLMTAVAFAVFLPWNISPPGLFLGDVGSYLLGAILGGCAINSMVSGVPFVVALAPLTLYLVDPLSTLYRRARKHERIFDAHRNHTYQRLVDAGISHMSIAGLIAVLTLITSEISLMVLINRDWAWFAGIFIVGIAAGYLSLPSLWRRRGVAPAKTLHTWKPDVEVISPREAWAPSRWAVVGASGFIGTAVVDHLKSNGVEVVPIVAPRVTLDRTSTDPQVVASAAEGHAATDAMARSLLGVDVVVNAAGMAVPDGEASPSLYGANGLLPAIIAHAAMRAGVGRCIHLSSAAVQGTRPTLDASTEVRPFSPYSKSKALGEFALLAAGMSRLETFKETDLILIRATSVQGHGRRTTENLRRVARSPLASVAAPGDYPTVVSSLDGLVDFVECVGESKEAMPQILLQPWEGLSVLDVMALAGGRRPAVLPTWICRSILRFGHILSRILPRVVGPLRRLELMWFGQAQDLNSPIGVSSNRTHIQRVLTNEGR